MNIFLRTVFKIMGRWNYLIQQKLKNTCNPTIQELKEKFTSVMDGLQKQPGLIQIFFCHPDLGYYN